MDKEKKYLKYIIFTLVMIILILVGYIFYSNNLFGIKDIISSNGETTEDKCNVVASDSADFVNKLNYYNQKENNTVLECDTYTVSYNRAKYILEKVPEGIAGSYGFEFYIKDQQINFEKYNEWYDFPTKYKIGNFQYHKLDNDIILALYTTIAPGDIYGLYYSVINLDNDKIIEGMEEVSSYDFDENTRTLILYHQIMELPSDCEYINSHDLSDIHSWTKEYKYNNGKFESIYNQKTYGDLKLENNCN